MNDKQAKAARRQKRTKNIAYEDIIKTRNEKAIKVCLNDYIDAQKAPHTAMQEVERRKARQTLERIARTGGTGSRSLRRKCISTGKDEIEKVLYKEGRKVTHPEEVKNATAEYFETLYKPHERELFNED